MPPTPAQKRAAFRQMHNTGCFVIPNPWDLGSARYLQSLGFKALATTSSGFAWTTGRADNAVPMAQILAHIAALAAGTSVPLNADFEAGFAREPLQMAENVKAAVGTGVAGLSIEDSTGDAADPLFDFQLAVERIKAARAAIDATGSDVMLTARTEGFIVGRPNLPETIKRLTAFAEAGADCLYAPGIKTDDEIGAVVRAVTPKPVNVLVMSADATVQKLAALGVRRISVGGALARTAWGGFMTAAKEMAEAGTFGGLATAASGAVLNTLFARPGP